MQIEREQPLPIDAPRRQRQHQCRAAAEDAAAAAGDARAQADFEQEAERPGAQPDAVMRRAELDLEQHRLIAVGRAAAGERADAVGARAEAGGFAQVDREGGAGGRQQAGSGRPGLGIGDAEHRAGRPRRGEDEIERDGGIVGGRQQHRAVARGARDGDARARPVLVRAAPLVGIVGRLAAVAPLDADEVAFLVDHRDADEIAFEAGRDRGAIGPARSRLVA